MVWLVLPPFHDLLDVLPESFHFVLGEFQVLEPLLVLGVSQGGRLIGFQPRIDGTRFDQQ